jgi:hypothetical protein
LIGLSGIGDLLHSIRAFSLRSRMRVSASSLDWTISDQSLVRASLLNRFSSSSCACVGFSMFPPYEAMRSFAMSAGVDGAVRQHQPTALSLHDDLVHRPQ